MQLFCLSNCVKLELSLIVGYLFGAPPDVVEGVGRWCRGMVNELGGGVGMWVVGVTIERDD